MKRLKIKIFLITYKKKTYKTKKKVFPITRGIKMNNKLTLKVKMTI